MMNEHEAAAIAQLCFYALLPPITLYIFVKNWNNRPRMIWYPLFAFSLIRLVGSILVIVEAQPENEGNLGLIVTALVMLNVGVVPLVMSSFSILRLLFDISEILQGRRNIPFVLKAMRASIFMAVSLLGTGGGLSSNADPNLALIGRNITRAGYVLLSVTIGIISVMLVNMWGTVRTKFSSTSMVYIKGATVAMPFLILRAVYGLLSVFSSDPFGTWNPLFGSAPAFALMALLPEYIVLWIYTVLGFYRMRHPGSSGQVAVDSEAAELSGSAKGDSRY